MTEIDMETFQPDPENVNRICNQISQIFEGEGNLNDIIPALTALLGNAIAQRAGNIYGATHLYLVTAQRLMTYMEEGVRLIERTGDDDGKAPH